MINYYMINSKAIGLFIPESYTETLNTYLRLIIRDKDFKNILNNKISENKKYEKSNVQVSLKIRYAISYCLREIKRKQLKKEIDINEKT